MTEMHMSIKPGTSVEIDLDPTSEGSKPLRALVYEVTGKRLILSQTSPPILPPSPKAPLYITYISRKGNRARRMGFSAAVSGFDDDYALLSGIRVPTIVVDMKREPEEASMRKASASDRQATAGFRSRSTVEITSFSTYPWRG